MHLEHEVFNHGTNFNTLNTNMSTQDFEDLKQNVENLKKRFTQQKGIEARFVLFPFFVDTMKHWVVYAVYIFRNDDDVQAILYSCDSLKKRRVHGNNTDQLDKVKFMCKELFDIKEECLEYHVIENSKWLNNYQNNYLFSYRVMRGRRNLKLPSICS